MEKQNNDFFLENFNTLECRSVKQEIEEGDKKQFNFSLEMLKLIRNDNNRTFLLHQKCVKNIYENFSS